MEDLFYLLLFVLLVLYHGRQVGFIYSLIIAVTMIGLVAQNALKLEFSELHIFYHVVYNISRLKNRILVIYANYIQCLTVYLKLMLEIIF